jgi:hypothetical protein
LNRLRALRTPLVVLLLALALAGCKNRHKVGGSLSELRPPKDAAAWESSQAVAFDDSYTPTPVNLQGRAPNDVRDQQLFQARLGYADIVVLTRVEQVWGKGRYQGRQNQFVELELGDVLLGALPKDAPEQLMLEVESIDELPGELKGEVMLLFVRWDAESEPPFHHHLMPADEELVELIKAMVQHAQVEGVLDAKGDATKAKKGKSKSKGKRGRKGRKERGGDDGPLGPSEPVEDGGAAGSAGEGGTPLGGGLAPDTPPPPDGPQPDSSTGLDKLSDDKPADDSGAASSTEADLPPK